MIIIPELNTIYVRVPGNEDGSFSNAILNKYKDSRIIYNQMEVEGIPIEFKHFNKIGFVRNPVDRLWNFYNDHRTGNVTEYSYNIYGISAKDYDFETWIMLNSACFPAEVVAEKTRSIYNGSVSLYDLNAIIHHIPENQKSQFFYLSPTSGAAKESEEAKDAANNLIALFPYSHIQELAQIISINEKVCYEDKYGPAPEIKSKLIIDTMARTFAWDYRIVKSLKDAIITSSETKIA